MYLDGLGCNRSFFALVCFSTKRIKESPTPTFFLTYIYQPQKTLICSQKENPYFLFFLFFPFCNPSFLCICISLPKTQFAEGNPLSFLLFLFLFKIKIPLSFLWRILSSHMYAAKSISSLQKYFCLPSLSVHAFVRVDPQPPFSCQTIKLKIKRIKPKKS